MQQATTNPGPQQPILPSKLRSKEAPPNSIANEPPVSNTFDHVINLLFGCTNRLCYPHSFNKHFLNQVHSAGTENPEIVCVCVCVFPTLKELSLLSITDSKSTVTPINVLGERERCRVFWKPGGRSPPGHSEVQGGERRCPENQKLDLS